ncbi:hypothetical protein K3495_g7286 [Podosphaera aphanis]|nr:hypothetical protein K3495_g7286 [Podosphaera aphanis]
MSIGFEFSFPEGSYLYVDPLRGKILEDNLCVVHYSIIFTKLMVTSKQGPVNSLPIIVRSGRSEFAAALRVRFQGGVTIMHSGTGYDFELAIFANLLEYHNSVQRSNYTDIDPAELDPSLIDGTCNLLVSQSLDTTYGSYAHAVAHINYLKKGFSPTSQRTVFETTLATSCLDSGTPQTQSPTSAVISSSKNAVPTKIVSSKYLNYATVAPDDDYMPKFPAIRPVIVIPRATHIP